jgi:hypothetical protein
MLLLAGQSSFQQLQCQHQAARCYGSKLAMPINIAARMILKRWREELPGALKNLLLLQMLLSGISVSRAHRCC